MPYSYLKIQPEVETALAEGRPVVALESTIIAHGMPYPANLETARQVEQAVRQEGATPATIAIRDGRIQIGLDEEELEHLARGREVVKVSRRDLGLVLARRQDGATTVAATMIAAARAGIEVFVTGGIGGVHRGAPTTFDVSADLTELGRTPVAVVCAGAKSILDLSATLEVLETWGVPVFGFGTDRFPAFYTRDSGVGVSARVDSEAELAGVIRTHWNLGLESGVVVANPIPRQHEIDPELADGWIRQALAEADGQGLAGRDVTPFLLAKIGELSGGLSLKANIELVLSNAAVGARLAHELASYE